MKLKIEVKDRDSLNKADYVDFIAARVRLQPTLYAQRVRWTPLTIAARTTLNAEVAVICDGESQHILFLRFHTRSVFMSEVIYWSSKLV